MNQFGFYIHTLSYRTDLQASEQYFNQNPSEETYICHGILPNSLAQLRLD